MPSIFQWEYHRFDRGWNEDGVSWVRTLADEEPLEVVKACVNSVWKVVGEYVLNGFDSMRWKGECTLHGNGHGGTSQQSVRAEDCDLCQYNQGSGRRWNGRRGGNGRGYDDVVVV
jgi:hypothetical protein